jgi:hypothetical protein
MQIKCILNKVKGLPNDLILSKGYKDDHKFNLTIGRDYIVYAINVYSDYVWYCVCDDNHENVPLWYPAPLFSIEQNNVSRYWHMKIPDANEENENHLKLILSFSEWLERPYFHYDLFDGQSEETEIFKKYKKLMDLEFPTSKINDKASDIEEGWVMCPYCIDAWQPNQVDAMIVCPKCSRVMHSPYYGK